MSNAQPAFIMSNVYHNEPIVASLTSKRVPVLSFYAGLLRTRKVLNVRLARNWILRASETFGFHLLYLVLLRLRTALTR